MGRLVDDASDLTFRTFSIETLFKGKHEVRNRMLMHLIIKF